MGALPSFLGLVWAGSGAVTAACMDAEVAEAPGLAALVTLGPLTFGGLALLAARLA